MHVAAGLFSRSLAAGLLANAACGAKRLVFRTRYMHAAFGLYPRAWSS